MQNIMAVKAFSAFVLYVDLLSVIKECYKDCERNIVTQ